MGRAGGNPKAGKTLLPPSPSRSKGSPGVWSRRMTEGHGCGDSTWHCSKGTPRLFASAWPCSEQTHKMEYPGEAAGWSSITQGRSIPIPCMWGALSTQPGGRTSSRLALKGNATTLWICRAGFPAPCTPQHPHSTPRHGGGCRGVAGAADKEVPLGGGGRATAHT